MLYTRAMSSVLLVAGFWCGIRLHKHDFMVKVRWSLSVIVCWYRKCPGGFSLVGKSTIWSIPQFSRACIMVSFISFLLLFLVILLLDQSGMLQSPLIHMTSLGFYLAVLCITITVGCSVHVCHYKGVLCT